MVVPTDTTVVLKVTATDVIHSWWIPKLGGKVDGVPGHTNDTWFKIPAGKEGVYRASAPSSAARATRTCAREVRAVSPDEFKAWADRQRRGHPGGRRAALRAAPAPRGRARG